jgi:nitrate reductase assembly molybdenum cofactor insertion protein NarJ
MSTLESVSGQGVGETPAAFLLASLLTSYPDEAFTQSLSTLLKDESAVTRLRAADELAWNLLQGFLDEIASDPEAVRDLRALYVDTFERSRPSTSLYETEYGLGRAVAKGPELLNIATYYQSFGFAVGEGEGDREMVDHLAVELEFYALMSMKLAALTADFDAEGVAIVEDARRGFLREHLGAFTKSILTRPGVAGSAFYACVMRCVDALIGAECVRLGVEQRQREWQDDLLNEEDEVKCGSGGCLSGNPDTLSPQNLRG